jgi:acylphosphatase
LSTKAALHATVYGHVQGVYFRAFVAENAGRLGLQGWVRNSESAEAVEVMAEGDKETIEQLVRLLKTGPPHARVSNVTTEWKDYSGKFSDFRILYF